LPVESPAGSRGHLRGVRRKLVEEFNPLVAWVAISPAWLTMVPANCHRRAELGGSGLKLVMLLCSGVVDELVC